MEQTDAAGGIANADTLLHATAARSILDSLNATSMTPANFRVPLRIETAHGTRGITWATTSPAGLDARRPGHAAESVSARR
jgi:hypothetical protein